MRLLAAVILWGLSPTILPAAEPCVGAGFDVPLPGASLVERKATDAPSARYSGVWQQGRVAGMVYQLSSDNSGVLAPHWETPGWQITFLCEPEEGQCQYQSQGQIAEDADAVARLLGDCMIGASVTAEDFARLAHAPATGLPPDAGVTDVERPIPPHVGVATAAGSVGARQEPGPTEDLAADSSDEGAPEADSPLVARNAARNGDEAAQDSRPAVDTDRLGPAVHPPQDCGLAGIDLSPSPVRTLQRLLASAGYNPGPVDGLMGNQTRTAIVEALGAEAADLSIEDAISALDARLCDG